MGWGDIFSEIKSDAIKFGLLLGLVLLIAFIAFIVSLF
jgi:hypothetical protein